ncbi:MFS transporter [Pseudarthrobacter enclensis]|uniref:EmrB/QacA subfamily drug resistance transporter n=1 Tax=Pseudarthrobacter enclensis TaxID=993070 RepID=A0ABT9RXP8_9MICC|nr:MFS transporter [Pseudarthrobacter enclensis]MDP9889586.1 EmrB/QacA subfamily drug resistance transporter [Pseudarthrobacter enclensis]
MTSTTFTGAPAGIAPAESRVGSIGLWLVMLAQLMLVLDATVVNVALPHIATDLHFSRAELSWVLNGYSLAFGGLLLLGGRIGDVFGRRRTFLIGVGAFTVFSLLGGLATSPLLLVVARALQGLGAAFAAPSVLALITTSARDEGARNRALALFSAIASMGGALGLILGGLLTDLTSWRWTLFINVPIGVVVLLAVPRLVTETPRRPGRFDLVGALTATGGAVALVWALIQAGDAGWSSPRTICGLAVGAILIAILTFTERRVAHPLLRPQLLRSPSRVAALAAMAATYAGMLAMFFLMVQYLQGDLRLSPLVTGLAFLPMPLSIFTMSRIVPRLVERFGAVRLVILGAALRVVGFLPLTQLGPDTPFMVVMAALLLTGISAGLTFMPLTTLALRNVEPEHAGSASGLFQTMQQLGGAVGLAIVASTYAAFAVPGDFLPGGRAGFWSATILSALALAAVIGLIIKPRKA